MKFYHYLFALLALIFVFSCTKDEAFLSKNPDIESVVYGPQPAQTFSVTTRETNTLSITWSFPENNIDGVRYTLKEAGTVSLLTNVTNASITTSATFTGLDEYTVYTVEVVAFNDGGENAATYNAQTKAVVPDGVLNFRSEGIGYNNVYLVWDKVENASGYRILYNDASIPDFIFGGDVTVDGKNNTSYNVTGLAADTTNWFWISTYRGYTSNSTRAARSTTDVVTNYTTLAAPSVVPTAPTNLVVQESGRYDDQLFIDFTDTSSGTSTEGNFLAYYNTVSNFATATQAGYQIANLTNIIVTNLEPATDYYLWVAAQNSSGTVESVIPSFASTLPADPTAPSGLQMLATASNGVRLTWNDNSSDETHFRLYYTNGSVDQPSLSNAYIAAGAESTIVLDLKELTTYNFWLTAAKDHPNNESTAVSVSDLVPLYQPSQFTTTERSQNYISFSWLDNSSSETGYSIELTGDNTITSNVISNTTSVTIDGLVTAGEFELSLYALGEENSDRVILSTSTLP